MILLPGYPVWLRAVQEDKLAHVCRSRLGVPLRQQGGDVPSVQLRNVGRAQHLGAWAVGCVIAGQLIRRAGCDGVDALVAVGAGEHADRCGDRARLGHPGEQRNISLPPQFRIDHDMAWRNFSKAFGEVVPEVLLMTSARESIVKTVQTLVGGGGTAAGDDDAIVLRAGVKRGWGQIALCRRAAGSHPIGDVALLKGVGIGGDHRSRRGIQREVSAVGVDSKVGVQFTAWSGASVLVRCKHHEVPVLRKYA